VDIDAAKLERVKAHGATAVVDVKGMDARAAKDAVRQAAKGLKLRSHMWKVLEMSGTAPGQTLAYELFTFGGTVGFIGFCMDKVSVRLGNFMAFDAMAFGNWGCLPELYPAAVGLVVSGKIQTRPFTKRFPLDEINAVIAASRSHELTERPVLVP
jgi:6-hydroxycyclohex-1-ene-1-carbonyl-CoA dehydrogenase